MVYLYRKFKKKYRIGLRKNKGFSFKKLSKKLEFK